MDFRAQHLRDSLLAHKLGSADSGVQAWGRARRCYSTGNVATWGSPIVSIVVPFLGLPKSILRILKGNPKKELQWRLQAGCGISDFGLWIWCG